MPSDLMKDQLLVSEIFESIQGEGPSMGLYSSFLRLSGCNLDCSWCDTKYTWDWNTFDPREESERMHLDLVTKRLVELGPRRLVITGGEPFLQQEKINRLAWTLHPVERFAIEIETNGTIAPCAELMTVVEHFTVSPKLSNSGIPIERRIIRSAIRGFRQTNKTKWKFVVQDLGCMNEVDDFVNEWSIDSNDVWIMPEGVTTAEVSLRLEFLGEATLNRGYNLSTRLQAYAFRGARGK